MEIKPSSIAIGMVQVTAILEKGAKIDTWPKFIIIIGRVKERADRVKVKAVFISKVFGKKENTFSKNFCV